MLGIRPERRARHKQAGFTIIELLIATAVFSVLLLVITAAIVRFTTEYYKGVTLANTQNTARTILNTISQDIQFSPSGNLPVQAAGSFCVGGHEYMYRLYTEVTDSSPYGASQGPHALLENTASGDCSMPAGVDITRNTPLPSGVRELVGPHMRLADLEVIPLDSQLYQIKLRLVYGDDDLLCSPTVGDCNSRTTSSPSNLSATDLSCKGQTGSQFCAVSDLSTIVQKRLQ